VSEEAKGPGGRPTLYEPRYCEELVADMTAGFSMGAFAGKIGVARSTLNEWAEHNPEFSEAISRGKAARLRHWEEAALNVAKRGGGPGTAQIITFGLKNMDGGDWSDTTKHEMTGKDGGAIKSESSLALPAEVVAAMEALKPRK
jgi:hypothetical protein